MGSGRGYSSILSIVTVHNVAPVNQQIQLFYGALIDYSHARTIAKSVRILYYQTIARYWEL